MKIGEKSSPRENHHKMQKNQKYHTKEDIEQK